MKLGEWKDPVLHSRLRQIVYRHRITFVPFWRGGAGGRGMWTKDGATCCGRGMWSPVFGKSTIWLHQDYSLDCYVLAHELGHYFALWASRDDSESAADAAAWRLLRQARRLTWWVEQIVEFALWRLIHR